MSRSYSILIAEDDVDVRSILVEQMALGDEFSPVEARTVAEAVDLVRTRAPDLAIVSLSLPDAPGAEAVRVLRAEGFDNPLIALTDQTRTEIVAGCFEAGASDCLAKPFRFAVLLARMRVHIRNLEVADDAEWVIGCYTFRPLSKQLQSEAGDRLRLTEKETDILRFLYRQRGQVVARDTLLREVWGYNAQVTTHTLETHMYRLRQKIEEDPANARLLITESGGYRLDP